MAEVLRVSLDEVVVHFAELEDPRSTVNQLHPFVSVVVIALMAVLAGANGPTAIARWAAVKEDGFEAERLPSLLCDLVAIVAGQSGRSDGGGTTDLGCGRQDGTAEP